MQMNEYIYRYIKIFIYTYSPTFIWVELLYYYGPA